jgi:limonene-1,2-epoxide hydrolase
MLRAMTPKELVLEFWRVIYEERDYEKVGTFFHPQGRYEDVPIPDGPGVGPAGISRRLAFGHEPVERFEHEIHRIVAEGNTVVTEHTETWCFHTGEVIALPFCSIHEVRDGKFDLWRDFSNIGTVLENAPQWWLEHIATGKPEDFLS